MTHPAGRPAAARVLDAFRRVDAFDRCGPQLNALPVLDVRALRATNGIGRLAGRVFSVKDSMAVAGMPVSAGSPAFTAITAERDATVVRRLRDEGAILLGKSNMPPVAIGGGQPGVYGRTRSPFNPQQLAAAWHSGSSIGSAVSVAAGYVDFGLGEETVSSGRSPASNNALVAYTPSWGVLSNVGNLPLHPYRDVVVPHTTDIDALLTILPIIAGPDDEDVWHRQSALDMSVAIRTAQRLASPIEAAMPSRLRLGVPRLYVGESTTSVSAIPMRASIRALWDRTAAILREAGVELIPVDFPLVESYEHRSDRPGFEEQGFIPSDWTAFELGPLMTASWHRFLRRFGDGTELASLPANAIRPTSPWATDITLPDLRHPGRDTFDFARIVGDDPLPEAAVLGHAEPAVRALDAGRRALYEEWLDQLALDGLIFPANADIGSWAAETDPSAARRAWRDGSLFSHGNHVLRRVGIPTVTVPMGLIDDLRMPVGVTVAGRAWDDARLLGIGAAVEELLPPRPAAPLPDIGAAPLDFHEPVFACRSDAAPSVAIDVRPSVAGDRTIVEIRADAGVRIELLGRVLELDGSAVTTVDASPEDWGGLRPPLAILTPPDRDPTRAAVVELEMAPPDEVLESGSEDEFA